MSNPKQYLPWIYNNVREMDELMETERRSLDELNGIIDKWWANQYIPIADEDGIKVYEDQIGIIANPATEDLEFRRRRLLNRYSLYPPFTMRYLRIKLNEIIGVGKWNAWVDNDAFTLYIESSAENQNWYQEILITLHSIKPANIVFINKPLLTSQINISEAIDRGELVWKYKLGTQWVLGASPFLWYKNSKWNYLLGTWPLGQEPFLSKTWEGLVLATTPSIKQRLLNDVASFTAGEIAKVRLNGALVINGADFTVHMVEENVVTIEYQVDSSSGFSSVDQIEVLNKNDAVLTSSAVYVPLIEGASFKHTLLVKEGI